MPQKFINVFVMHKYGDNLNNFLLGKPSGLTGVDRKNFNRKSHEIFTMSQEDILKTMDEEQFGKGVKNAPSYFSTKPKTKPDVSTTGEHGVEVLESLLEGYYTIDPSKGAPKLRVFVVPFDHNTDSYTGVKEEKDVSAFKKSVMNTYHFKVLKQLIKENKGINFITMSYSALSNPSGYEDHLVDGANTVAQELGAGFVISAGNIERDDSQSSIKSNKTGYTDFNLMKEGFVKKFGGTIAIDSTRDQKISKSYLTGVPSFYAVDSLDNLNKRGTSFVAPRITGILANFVGASALNGTYAKGSGFELMNGIINLMGEKYKRHGHAIKLLKKAKEVMKSLKEKDATEPKIDPNTNLNTTNDLFSTTG